MSGGAIKALELALIFGAVIAWAAWELYTLRRDRKRSEGGKPRADASEGPVDPPDRDR